jgi:hypothetical protein
MSYGRVRTLLWIGAGVAFLAGVVFFVAIYSWPIGKFDAVATLDLPKIGRSPQGDPTTILTLKDFGESLSSPLQAALVDEVAVPVPVVAVKEAEPVPPAKIDAQLLGTAVVSSAIGSVAWIRIANQPAQAVREGQTIANLPGRPLIKFIQARRVIFEVQGQEVALEIKDSHAS